MNPVPSSTDSQMISTAAPSNDTAHLVKLMKVVVKFNHNSVMTQGYGNSRKQAERNASINGLRWLH